MDTTTKTCPKCGETKPVESFNPASSGVGFYFCCRKCATIEVQKWRKANHEKARATYAAYRAANLAKFREYEKAWAASPAARERNRDAARRNTAELSDAYVASSMHMPVSQCPPELIEAKRLHMKIKRLIKELKK